MSTAQLNIISAAFLGASYDTWNWLFGAITVLILAVGGAISISQLQSVARNNRLQGLITFHEAVRNQESRTWRILAELPVRSAEDGFDDLPKELLEDASLLTNTVNDIGQLLEAGLIDCRYYFQSYHTQLLRIVFLLRPYTKWRELSLGGMYGRRLFRLEYSARRWHAMDAARCERDIYLSRPEGRYRLVRGSSEHAPRLLSWLCMHFETVARWYLKLDGKARDCAPTLELMPQDGEVIATRDEGGSSGDRGEPRPGSAQPRE